MVKMAQDLGVKTVYLEDLISGVNFENVNNIYDKTDVVAVLEVRIFSLGCLWIWYLVNHITHLYSQKFKAQTFAIKYVIIQLVTTVP